MVKLWITAELLLKTLLLTSKGPSSNQWWRFVSVTSQLIVFLLPLHGKSESVFFHICFLFFNMAASTAHLFIFHYISKLSLLCSCIVHDVNVDETQSRTRSCTQALEDSF